MYITFIVPIQWRRNEFESGGTGSEHCWKKNFLLVPLQFFALLAQLVVLVSAFVMVSTVWSVSCLLFFYSYCPPCPAICKSGGTCPLCPMESAPLYPSMGTWVQKNRTIDNQLYNFCDFITHLLLHRPTLLLLCLHVACITSGLHYMQKKNKQLSS